MRWRAGLALLLGAGGCAPDRAPPPSLSFEGLPVSGSLADAKRAGFAACVEPDWNSLRCRRHDVMVDGAGPFEGAVDFASAKGGGGFNQLVLWHPHDQYAVYAITDRLERHGWRHCSTGTGDRGDQIIYTHSGAAVRVSMDLSYWGRRRLRILPLSNREPVCRP